jgi:hypothetical protein
MTEKEQKKEKKYVNQENREDRHVRKRREKERKKRMKKNGTQPNTLMFQMDGPGDKGTMVQGCPSVGCKVDFAWVLHKDVGNAITAELERQLDVVSDGPCRRQLHIGLTHQKEFVQLTIRQ